MWHVERSPNELINLAEEISRQNMESVNLLLKIKYEKRSKLKIICFSLPTKFTGNIKDPGHTGGEIKTVLIHLS